MIKRQMNGTRKRRVQSQNKQPKLSTSSKEQPSSTKGAIIFVILLTICLLYYIFIYSQNTIKRTLHESASIYTKLQHTNDAEEGILFETEYMYQFPIGIEKKMSKGIIFLAHGCSHSATDFFPPSINCPKCLGLPEERSLIRFFLKEKFTVITISSQNRDSKCWHTALDTKPVKQVLLHFKTAFDIQLLPLYAFGASSGGTFVGSLATNVNFIDEVGLDGIIVQISAVNIGFDDVPFNMFIPVLFIPMSKDLRLLGIVRKQMDILRKNGDTISQLCEVMEIPIGGLYFYRQIGDVMTPEISKQIYKGLKQQGLINEKEYLIDDPRRSGWRYAVKSSIGQDVLNEVLFDSLVADESAISEEMNVAYGLHEITAQCKPEMSKFIKAIENAKLVT
eukprot:520242_1